MTTVGLVSVDPERKWIGGRYYLQHLVRCVHALPEHERPALADIWWGEMPADDPFAEVRGLLSGPRVITLPSRLVPRIVRRARRLIRGWTDARDLFRDAGIDVLFPIVPAASPGIPFVFWMPDFQPWRMPELFAAGLRDKFAAHYSENGALATRIVVSSADGLRDLETFFPHLAAKGRILRFCSVPSDEWTRLDPATVARARDLPDRFFILPNQFSHHKNHRVVFEAVHRLRTRDLPAVVVCTGSLYGYRGDDYFQELEAFIRERDLGDAIRIAGMLPRAEQIALLRRAIAVLQPSRFEGWSTVVEDAKTLGKPLLVSDIAVHREQASPGATYLPVDEPEAWADAMEAAWNRRAPGPNLDEERRGRAALNEAMIDTGRTFARIMNEAAR
jgi:glycosyltransferase involved in cell wall biosynthesis